MGIEDILSSIALNCTAEMLYEAGKWALQKIGSYVDRQRNLPGVRGPQPEEGVTRADAGIDSDMPDVQIVLSNDTLDALLTAVQKENISSRKEAALQVLIDAMTQDDISCERKRWYAENCLEMLLTRIHEMDPERYASPHLEEVQEDLRRIEEKIDRIDAALLHYRKESMRIMSSDEMDLRLRCETNHPKIGISFFIIDDEDFRKEFAKKCNDPCVYVKGRSREETLYSILNELLRIGDRRDIYVVENVSSWNKLFDTNAEGKVFIADFYSDRPIPAIEGATCIYLLTEPQLLAREKILHLGPRLYVTIVSALQNAGMDRSEAYELVSETHGLYVPMKKKIYNGAYLEQPEWLYGLKEEVLKTCILVGAWTESEGDKATIEFLSGMTYESFMQALQPYVMDEDPFIYVSGEGQNRHYCLTSAENSWDYIRVETQEPIWQRFEESFSKIMGEAEPWFTREGNESILMHIKGEKPFWSEEFRKGMMHTFLLHDFYCNGYTAKSRSDRLVKSILTKVQSEDQWHYISHFFQGLCEMAPEAVLSRMEQERETPTGLRVLFERHSGNALLNIDSDGSRIRSGMEMLLTLRPYASRAWIWLLRMDDLSEQYDMENMDHIAKRVLCPWMDFTAFQGTEKKLEAARLAMDYDRKGWKRVYESLTGNNRTLVGWQYVPEYREFCQRADVERDVVWATEAAYLHLLLQNMDCKKDRWIDLITYASKSQKIWNKEISDQFQKDLRQMDDGEIADIKKQIRVQIYCERLLHPEAKHEEIAVWYESLLDTIHTTDPEYEVLYLFVNNGIVPQLHPVSRRGRDSYKENERMQKEMVRGCLYELRTTCEIPTSLIRICAAGKNSLGRSLARYWNDGMFVPDMFRELLACQRSGEMAEDYVAYITTWNDDILPSCLEIAHEYTDDLNFIAHLYWIEARKTKGLPMIAEAPVALKQVFWKQPHFCEHHLEWQLGECKKYGTLQSYLELLYQVNKETPFEPAKLLEYMVGIESMERSDEWQTASFFLKELLRPIQNEYRRNGRISILIARIEVVFFSVMDWSDMICYQEALKRSPAAYAELVSKIFPHQNQGEMNSGNHSAIDSEMSREKDSENRRILIDLYYKSEFCPAERDGKVDFQELSEWVDQFKSLLQQIGQSHLYGFRIGRLLAYSPAGTDGHSPCEAVRKIIERDADESLMNAYETSIYNRRGIYTFSAGKEESEIAQSYRSNADSLCIKYPCTAQIYYRLADAYDRDARHERYCGENGY